MINKITGKLKSLFKLSIFKLLPRLNIHVLIISALVGVYVVAWNLATYRFIIISYPTLMMTSWFIGFGMSLSAHVTYFVLIQVRKWIFHKIFNLKAN